MPVRGSTANLGILAAGAAHTGRLRPPRWAAASRSTAGTAGPSWRKRLGEVGTPTEFGTLFVAKFEGHLLFLTFEGQDGQKED